MKQKVILVAFWMAIVATSAQAGQIIPPLDENGNKLNGNPCPDNSSLYWDGESVYCLNVLPEIDIACPDGTVLVEIKGGTPTCEYISPDVSVSACPEGQSMVGISHGDPVCVPDTGTALTDYKCFEPSIFDMGVFKAFLPGQVMVGVYEGRAVCDGTLLTNKADCPPGQVVTAVSAENLATCTPNNSTSKLNVTCPAGKILHAIIDGKADCWNK